MPFANPTSVTAGSVLTASRYNADVVGNWNTFADAWTSWTPTVDASSGWKPTLTNTGSRYLKIGRLVLFYATFTINTVNTGSVLTLALPVTAANTLQFQAINVSYEDTGTAQYQGIVYGASTTAINVGVIATSGTYAQVNALQHTVPFTWATGDGIRLSGFYEAAS